MSSCFVRINWYLHYSISTQLIWRHTWILTYMAYAVLRESLPTWCMPLWTLNCIYAVTGIDLHIRSWYQAYTAYTIRSYIPVLTTTTTLYTSLYQYTQCRGYFSQIPLSWNITFTVQIRFWLYSATSWNYTSVSPNTILPDLHYTRIRFEAKLLAKKNHVHVWATETHLFPQPTTISDTCVVHGKWTNF